MRCPSLYPGTHGDQHTCGHTEGSVQGSPKRMEARWRFLILAEFPGRRGERMACGEQAQGTMCHHLKGKGFRRTLVPQWISPPSLW